MSDEKSTDKDILKIKMDDDIPVEEEPVDPKESKEEPDLVIELSNLGRQLGETISTAWNSEERQRFEREVKKGVQSFAHEVDKAFQDVRESHTAQKARDEASGFKNRVQEADLSQKTQSSIAQGLKWMSVELGNLAEQFAPGEKQPEGDLPSDFEDEG